MSRRIMSSFSILPACLWLEVIKCRVYLKKQWPAAFGIQWNRTIAIKPKKVVWCAASKIMTQIIYGTVNNLLPHNVILLLSKRDGGYNLRGELNLPHSKVKWSWGTGSVRKLSVLTYVCVWTCMCMYMCVHTFVCDYIFVYLLACYLELKPNKCNKLKRRICDRIGHKQGNKCND